MHTSSGSFWIVDPEDGVPVGDRSGWSVSSSLSLPITLGLSTVVVVLKAEDPCEVWSSEGGSNLNFGFGSATSESHSARVEG